MKNILVTGGCGFIGTNFIHYLLSNPDFDGRIINFDKLTYAGNLENLTSVEKEFRKRYIFIQADICDPKALRDAFATYGVDTICNFAAESHVDRSIAAPDAFIKTNIEGTFCLLEIAREQQNRLILFHHVSTDEVYGSLGMDGHFTEELALSKGSQPDKPPPSLAAGLDFSGAHDVYGVPGLTLFDDHRSQFD